MSSVIVDCENHGKGVRQQLHDTQIDREAVADIDAVANAVGLPITVRVKGGAAREKSASAESRSSAEGIAALMARLGCSPSFLRRTFHRGIEGRNLPLRLR